MAKRRMFNLDIVADDVFLDMSLSAQALYFQLGMNADDYGFITPRKIMRMIGANDDDLRLLILKRYVLIFPSGVVLVKHWPVMNNVQKDRRLATTYRKEFDLVTYNEFGAYTEKRPLRRTIKTPLIELQQSAVLEPEKQEIVNKMLPQIRLDKISKPRQKQKKDFLGGEDNKIIDYYNTVFGKDIKHLKGRLDKIKMRFRTFSAAEIMRSIDNAHADEFFNGGGGRGWTGDLDYLIRCDENVEKYLISGLSASQNDKQRILKERHEAFLRNT